MMAKQSGCFLLLLLGTMLFFSEWNTFGRERVGQLPEPLAVPRIEGGIAVDGDCAEYENVRLGRQLQVNPALTLNLGRCLTLNLDGLEPRARDSILGKLELPF